MKTTFLIACLLAGPSLLNTGAMSRTAGAQASVGESHKTATTATNKPIGTVRIVVDKSDYELQVYDAKGWYATYPVVFGNSSLADKSREGDRCTPEGTFRIVSKRPHAKWARFMGLDYPNKESLERFAELKRRGLLPPNATPGGGVGIHGTWPRDEYMIDRYSNWTNGCISMKNSDMIEMYNYVPIGTEVRIKK